MNEEVHNQLMAIKRSFRLWMNGPGSQSMRDKGLDYKINWGVPLIELKRMAAEYTILGRECEHEKMTEAAIRNYEKALELYPDAGDARKRLLKLTKKKLSN